MCKKSNIVDFIEKATKIHGDKYDYSKVFYLKSTIKVSIICKVHGEFLQTPVKHIDKRGCPKCGIASKAKLNSSNTQEFIKKAKIIHLNKYDYSETIYKKALSKIKIKCLIHGVFEQTANTHLNGSGCQLCKNKLTSNRNKENPTGWTHTNWEKAGNVSKNFDSFKVYIIECWNNDENFYKIGKTFTKLNDRFNGSVLLPYEYKIIKLFKGDARKISELENKLKINNKEHSYTPKIKFNGMYECFIKLENNEEFFAT